MKLQIQATDQLHPTKSGKGRMQVVGVQNGGAFPLEHRIYVSNDENPLKPGMYEVDAQLVKKGYALEVEFGLRNVVPASK